MVMMGMSGLSLWLTIFALGAFAAIAALWLSNYQSRNDAVQATRQTSQTIVGLIAGSVLVVIVAIAELSAVLGIFGDVIAMFPGGFAQLLLGTVAVLGVSGWLELSVVGMTVLVILIMAGSTAIRS